MTIDIVDSPINHGRSFHSYVKLPEGSLYPVFGQIFPSTSSGRRNESESNAFWEPIEAWLHSSWNTVRAYANQVQQPLITISPLKKNTMHHRYIIHSHIRWTQWAIYTLQTATTRCYIPGHFPLFFVTFQVESPLLLLSYYCLYAIYGNIYHQYTPNVSIYTIYMDPMGCWLK